MNVAEARIIVDSAKAERSEFLAEHGFGGYSPDVLERREAIERRLNDALIALDDAEAAAEISNANVRGLGAFGPDNFDA